MPERYPSSLNNGAIISSRISCSFNPTKSNSTNSTDSSYWHNARLSGEQRYHHTQLLHRKHKGQIKPKPPSVANPS
ncbi:hypothetical protein F3526_25140 [Vibrio parahaemolyticus]|nr:hypothetical protein [Vibrio parahaemolyticus]EGR3462100.1 hypothetical protein [Vibrio parahaemolyticus]